MQHPKLLYPFNYNANLSKTKEVQEYKKFSFIENDKEVLDLLLGSLCFPLGFDRHDIIDYVSSNMKNAPFVSGDYLITNPATVELAEKLYTMSNGYHSVFSTSGSDAIETAIKLSSIYHASKYNLRNKIIGFKNSYHGSTFLSSSIGNIEPMTKYWGTHANCLTIDYPYPSTESENATLESLEYQLEDAMCLIIESCSWNNGFTQYSPEFWQRLRRLCKKHDVLFIIDDIALCGGKTGSFFGFDLDLKPDLFCMGKALSGGYFPLSACLISESVINVIKDIMLVHGFTYSFSLSGIYSSLKYIDILEKENHLDNYDSVLETSLTLMQTLKSNDIIQSYTNYGLMFILNIKPTKERTFYSNGLNIGSMNGNSSRLIISIPINADKEYFHVLESKLTKSLKFWDRFKGKLYIDD